MKIKAKDNLFVIHEDLDIYIKEKTQKRSIVNCLFEFRYDIMLKLLKLLLFLVFIVLLHSVNDKINNKSSDIQKNINNDNITKYNITNKTEDNLENFVETNLESHREIMSFSYFKNIFYKIET